MTRRRDLAYRVSLGNPGEEDHNTIGLPLDVIVPLEMDIDGDPLQDDEIRLKSFDGSFEHVVLSSDDDVEDDEEARMMFYRFRDVPRGAYFVAVRIGGVWTTVIGDLLVGEKKVTVAGVEMKEAKPSEPMAHPKHFEPEAQDEGEKEDFEPCGCGRLGRDVEDL